MACSIESRVPFLDHQFVEFAAQVPGHLKIREGKGKYILQESRGRPVAADNRLPQEDGLPDADQELAAGSAGRCAVQEAAGSRTVSSRLIWTWARVNTMIEQHRNRTIDATDRIWRLLNLQYWGEIFLSGRDRVEEIYARVLEPVR